jgi:hypothetical protein
VRDSKSAVLGHYAGHRTPGAALERQVPRNRREKFLRFVDAPLATVQPVTFITSVPGVVADVVAFFFMKNL